MLIQSDSLACYTYLMSAQTFNIYLRDKLWTQQNTLFTSDSSALKLYNTPANLIPKAYILPFSILGTEIDTLFISRPLTNSMTIGTEHINIGSADDPKLRYIGGVGYYDYFTKSIVASYIFNPHPISDMNFTDLPTICDYKIYIPFFGTIDLPFFLYINGFKIDFYLDTTTGVLLYNIVEKIYDGYGKIILTDTTDVGIPLTIAGTNVRTEINARIDFMSNLIGSSVQALGGLNTATYTSLSKTTHTPELKVKSKRKLNKSTGRLRTQEQTKQQYSGFEEIDESVGTSSYSNKGAFINSTVNSLADLATMDTNVVSSKYQVNNYSVWNCPLNPYIIKIKPLIDSNYKEIREYCGGECRTIVKLNKLRGYVNVGMIHLSIDCTHNELEEIENLLTAGVIINKTVEECPDIIINTYDNISTISE